MEEKDDEISIDLGKIKSFFKRKKEEPKPGVQAVVENKKCGDRKRDSEKR